MRNPLPARRWHQPALLLAAGALLTAGALLAACSDAPFPTASPPPVDAERAAPASPAPPSTPEPTAPPPTPTPSPTASPSAERCADPLGCYGQPERAGTFDADAVPGASGLAASQRAPGVFYLLDDRRGTSEVWAIARDGTMLGAITVAGLDAIDTESLAIGPCGPDEPDPCVYVGDIGDNLRSRERISVYRFAEPDVAQGIPDEPVAADVAHWSYPDGAHDAEALLVDEHATVFIVTKAPFDPDTATTGETRLYGADEFADGVLTDLGAVPVPEPAAPLHSLLVGNVVTGGSYRDGRALLRTYDQVLEYVAPDADSDLATLAGWTVRALPSPLELQSEAITWAPDGCGYYTAGEMVGDLWFVPCVP